MTINSWKEHKAGELAANDRNSFVIGPFGSDLVQADYRDSGVPVVFVRDVKRSRFHWISNVYVSDQKAEALKAHSVYGGDIVITKMGLPPGLAAVYPDDAPAGVITADIIRLRPNTTQVNSAFLCEVLNSHSVRKQVYERTAGQTRPKLTLADYKTIRLNLPPLQEQKKIARILSTWDKAITTTEQLLANSQQQKKALMQQLLTGKKRLLDKNGVRFSREWQDIRLKSVLREVKTRNKNNSIDRVLSVTNHSGFVLPEEQFSKRVASDDVSNYKVVKNGEYGYNPSRLNVGSFARLDSYEEGLLSPMYVVFSVNEKLLNSDYFMNWMSSNEAKQRISGSTQGSVRDSVGFDSLCGFPFKLPPMAEQQKIAIVLSTADQEIAVLQQKLDALKQEKKALMQQLLMGKRRVLVN
ncbi:TPA: restriction endonuclease subunit S [Vibrio cholerae]